MEFKPPPLPTTTTSVDVDQQQQQLSQRDAIDELAASGVSFIHCIVSILRSIGTHNHRFQNTLFNDDWLSRVNVAIKSGAVLCSVN